MQSMLAAKPYLQSVRIRPDAEVDYDAYPYSIPAVRELGLLEFHPDVTFFVGENGSGKSTLLEGIALALGYSPEGGTRNFQLATTQSVSPLHEVLRLARSFRKPRDGYFLRAESFFNVATFMDEVGYLESYGGRSLHARSHGEAFMALLIHKFRGQGLYLLDEPEAALSPNGSWPRSRPSTSWCRTSRSSSSPRIRPSCCPIPTPGSSGLAARGWRKWRLKTPSTLR